MSTSSLLDLWREALTTVLLVAAPFLVAALAVGLVTAILQAATQMQDSVLSFVPKIIVVTLVFVFAGHLLLDKLNNYARRALDTLAVTQDSPSNE